MKQPIQHHKTRILKKIACNPRLSKKIRLNIISKRCLKEFCVEFLTVVEDWQVVTFSASAYYDNGNEDYSDSSSTCVFKDVSSASYFKFELKDKNENEIYEELVGNLDQGERISDFHIAKAYETLTLRGFIAFLLTWIIYTLISFLILFWIGKFLLYILHNPSISNILYFFPL